MDIQDIYNKKKDKLLFSNSIYFTKIRNDLIENFNLSPKNKKNNESIKHLDKRIFDFSYKYNCFSNPIQIIDENSKDININVIDGKVSKIKKNIANNSSIKIENIENEDDYIRDNFLFFKNNFKEDLVLSLNSLMLNSGYQIKIPENKNINIYISNSVSDHDLTVFQKNIIVCSKNTKVNLIEEFISSRPSNINVLNYFDLDKGSELRHFIFQNNSVESSLQNTSYLNCYEKSTYNQTTINFSNSSVRNHHYANLLGEGAEANLSGIFFGSSNNIIDNKTQINHNFPYCNSLQKYKGILTDKAKASYLSKTFVDKKAQKTEAYQTSKGILFSEDSSFHSKPELKIFADDVKCSHGSTIGPIDEDLLFYLRSRGLNKKNAISQLIKSFFHDIISNLSNKNLIEKFHYNSNNWLNKNNL